MSPHLHALARDCSLRLTRHARAPPCYQGTEGGGEVRRGSTGVDKSTWTEGDDKGSGGKLEKGLGRKWIGDSLLECE